MLRARTHIDTRLLVVRACCIVQFYFFEWHIAGNATYSIARTVGESITGDADFSLM